MQVAMFLQSRGFTQIANIAGGIDAWSVERDASVPRY
jgi:rhodanese-related sulfurtransferase